MIPMADPREANRILQRYAKHYHAGAFATPTLDELARLDIRTTGQPGDRTVAVVKRLTRASRRTDWTGRRWELPPGTTIVTHLARESDDAPSPWLTHADVVFAYREDPIISAWMEAAGRTVFATTITAAGEMIAAWARSSWDPLPTAPIDRLTLVEVPIPEIPVTIRAAAVDEVTSAVGWDDDYPFYSDGSWSGISLRGFWPDDPTRGVKPSEMSKAWKAEHAADLDRLCDWTVLAAECPALRTIVDLAVGPATLERVRLLRMAGTGDGHLGRHTDITDRAMGTGIGQVIRYHLPLVTHPAITMESVDLDGRPISRHLAAWRMWYLDARKPHAVTNPTAVDRLHLTIDVVLDAESRARLAEVAAS